MSKDEADRYIAAIEATAKHYMKTKEGARYALQSAGIIDDKGELTEHYRPYVQSETEPDTGVPRV